MQIKPLERLTKKLRLLLKINVGICVIAVAAGIFEYYIYKTLPAGFDINEQFVISDLSSGIVGLFQVIIYIILGITFLRWIYRTNKNLGLLSNEEMRFTPGWSVGWYFIPIANLFKPYQAMKEIWHVSHKHTAPPTNILIWWWFLWLISNFLGKIAFKSSLRAEDYSSYLFSTASYIISDGFDIFLGLTALLLVTRIGEAYSSNFSTLENENTHSIKTLSVQ